MKTQLNYGFSLLEVLVVIGIMSGIILGTINLLAGQIEARDEIALQGKVLHQINVAMQKVSIDIENIYLEKKKSTTTSIVTPELIWKDKKEMYFSINNFKSYKSNSFEGNIAQIKYEVEQDAKDLNKKSLIRYYDTNLKENIIKSAGYKQKIIEDLAEFEVNFWNGETFENDNWDTNIVEYKGILPKMVKIKLGIYFPLSPKEEQISTLEPKPLEKKKYVLETIVYLINSERQEKESKPSTKEYKWQ